ncbi:MAG: glucosyltransferase domain-containing protein [Clostridia bacterium]|nr:glucosyltransferase domain-containing protein [Clostridia bacterium]
MFLLNFIIIFAVVSVYQGQNFSSDGYGIYPLGLEDNVSTYYSSYRFSGALILKFLCVFNHNFFDNCTLDTLVFAVIACTGLSVFAVSFNNMLHVSEEKRRITLILTDLTLLIAVMNPSTANHLTFPECMILLGAGFFLTFLTASIFVRKTHFWTYIIAYVLIIVLTGIFQQFYALFAVLLITVCSVKCIQDDKSGIAASLKHYVAPAGCYILSGLSYFIIAKLLIKYLGIEGNVRADFTVQTLISKAVTYLTRQFYIWKGSGSIDSYKVKMLLASVTVGFFLVSLIYIVFRLIRKKQIAKSIVVFFALLTAYSLAFLPGIIESMPGVNVRTILGFYSIFFMFAGLCAASGDIPKAVYPPVIAVMTAVLCLFIFIMTGKELENKVGNTADNIWAKQIIYEIDRYQEENDVKIANVYICDDGDPQLNYMFIEWSRDGILKVFDSNNNYDVSEMTEEEQKRVFDNKTWEHFDADEQLVFDGDTLYVCAY